MRSPHAKNVCGFDVLDEITGETWRWGQHNYVRLDPFAEPAHVLAVQA